MDRLPRSSGYERFVAMILRRLGLTRQRVSSKGLVGFWMMTSGPLQFRVSDRYCQCYDYIDVVYRVNTVYKLIYFKYQHWILWFDCDSDTLIVIIRECICYWQLWYLLTPKILIDTLMFHPKRPYSQIDRMPSTLAAMLSLFAALRSAGSWGTPQGKVI